MATVTKIPIRNLYYILSYAWGRLPEDDPTYVEALNGSDTVELLARLLAAGMRHAIRHGLNRDYLPRTEEIPGIRGRLQFGESIRQRSFERGHTVCKYDELDYNNLSNQIIKTTLETLFNSQSFQSAERELKDYVAAVLKQLKCIESVKLHPSLFRRIRLHRGNASYGMLLWICELAFDSLLPEHDEGGHRFKNFVQDRDLMAGIFERFIRNFYARHGQERGYTKLPKRVVEWLVTNKNDPNTAVLPAMETDIMLESRDRKIIVDCKFYEDALSGGKHDGKKLISDNLYQIFAYVKNQSGVEGWENCEGLLLYPAVGKSFYHPIDLKDGTHIVAASVNLDCEWEDIDEQLLQLLGEGQTKSN